MNDFLKNLKAKLDEKGITQKELAEKTNISVNTIRGWFSKDFIPDVAVSTKIAKALDTTTEYLVTGKQLPSKSGFYVPFLNQTLSAGKGQFIPEEEQPENFIQVSDKLSKFKGHIAAITVRGDSMEPTLYDGDIAICDNLGYDNSEGIFVVYLNNNGYIKRVQIGVDEILIKSDNPNYDTIKEPIGSQAIQIVGKLRAFIRVL